MGRKINTRNFSAWLEHLSRTITFNEFLTLSKLSLVFISPITKNNFGSSKKKKKFVNSKELEDLHYFLNKINKFELSIGFCKYFFDSLEKKIDSIIKRNLRQHKDLKGMKMKIYNEILIQSGLCDNSNILLIFEVYRRIENLGEFGRGKEFRRGRFFNIEAMVNFYGFFFESNSLLI